MEDRPTANTHPGPARTQTYAPSTVRLTASRTLKGPGHGPQPAGERQPQMRQSYGRKLQGDSQGYLVSLEPG